MATSSSRPPPDRRADTTSVARIQPAAVWKASAASGASVSAPPPLWVNVRCQGFSPTETLSGPEDSFAARAGAAAASAAAATTRTVRARID